MGVFDIVKDIEVREAFIASRGKKMIYEPEEYEFMRSYILSDECERDIDRLNEGDFYFDYPQYRLVPKNSGSNRMRAIYLFPGKPGILLKLLTFALRDMEKCYSDRLFSFRTDKSAAELLLEVRANPEMKDLYVLKTDITNYVGSIVPEILLPMIEPLLDDDPAFYRFLEWLLTRNKVYDREGNLIDHCPGGMGGIPLSNFFMNLYLHELDDYFAPRAAFYSRYSDDILICARTYEEIKEYEKTFFEFLDKLHLKTNTDKTMLIMPGEPFELLGMELCQGKISISPHSMAKLKRKLRRTAKASVKRSVQGYMSREAAARRLVDRYNRLFFGAKRSSAHLLTWAKWAFPVISDTSCLQELDHYFQDSLRYVLYGSMKKRNRSIPYEKLGELGYKSLVYYYHHPDKIKEIS